MAGTPLNAYPPIHFSITVTEGEKMPYRIEKKEAFRIVGVRTALADNVEENFRIAPEFWKSFLKSPSYRQVCRLNDRHPDGILGVNTHISSGEFYSYAAAATSQPVPGEMAEMEIPAATWAIFDCRGCLPESI
jgi:AraC family transcriptional regulator